MKIFVNVTAVFEGTTNKASKSFTFDINTATDLITPADVASAKRSGQPINVSSTNTMDIASLKTAKANFTTYE